MAVQVGGVKVLRGKIDHVILDYIKVRKRNTGGKHIRTPDFSRIDFKMFTEKLFDQMARDAKIMYLN